ncbi:MAG: tetratricopeptide repeat protein, partial [Chitinophagales bacterium]
MKFKSLIFILAIVLPYLLFAQENSNAEKQDPLKDLPYKKKLKFADNAFEYGNYFQAMELYKSFLEERPGNNQLFYKIAYCYMEARDYKNAESHFKKAISAGNTNAETYYYKALMLNMQGKYDAAKNTYADAVKKNTAPWSDRAKQKIEFCEFAKKLIKDSANYKVTHLERPVNGPFTEYAPRVYDAEFYYSSLNMDSILNQQFYRGNKKHYSRIYTKIPAPKGENWKA